MADDKSFFAAMRDAVASRLTGGADKQAAYYKKLAEEAAAKTPEQTAAEIADIRQAALQKAAKAPKSDIPEVEPKPLAPQKKPAKSITPETIASLSGQAASNVGDFIKTVTPGSSTIDESVDRFLGRDRSVQVAKGGDSLTTQPSLPGGTVAGMAKPPAAMLKRLSEQGVVSDVQEAKLPTAAPAAVVPAEKPQDIVVARK